MGGAENDQVGRGLGLAQPDHFPPFVPLPKISYASDMKTTPQNHKKILYIITKSNFGGAQKYVYELATEMRKLDYEVAVACGGNGELVEKLHQANIKTYEVNGFQRDISIFKEIKAFFSLIRIIHNFQPDIVHLNSAKAGGLGALTSRLLRVPKIIFTVHGWSFLEPRPRLWKILAWLGSYFTCLLAHKIITVSQHDFRHTNMPGVQKKLTTIHTAIASYPLLPREEAREKLIGKTLTDQHLSNLWLVTIAELNNNKNHVTAIDAVAEYNSSHANKIFYTLIGSGELQNSLKEQVNLRGMTDYVLFLDYVENAKQYLLAFDIFLLPSKKEGLPYVLLEAGLAGLPCIASRDGGIPEVISDQESGLLIDPNNHMSIIEALTQLMNNPDERMAYSYNLADSIRNNFNLEQMVKSTEEIYNH